MSEKTQPIDITIRLVLDFSHLGKNFEYGSADRCKNFITHKYFAVRAFI